MSTFSTQLLQTTLATTFRSAGVIYSASTAGNNRRIRAYEINVGQTASAYFSADASILWDVSRLGASANLAGSSIIPNLLDGTDGTSVISTYFNNLTADPTYTTQGNGLSLYSWPINQRGFNRWRALDDYDQIVVPNPAFNGIGIRILAPAGALATMSGIGTLAGIES